jgi:hypothetical protein
MQDNFKVVDRECDMHRSNIARPEIEMFSVFGCEIFKQFDFVPARRFQDGEGNLCAGHTSDFSGEFTRLMYAVREFEAKNIAPENEGSLEI